MQYARGVRKHVEQQTKPTHMHPLRPTSSTATIQVFQKTWCQTFCSNFINC